MFGNLVITGAYVYARCLRAQPFVFCPDRPWVLPSLLCNGCLVFPEGNVRPGLAADHSPLLVPLPWKSRAIPLPTLWATTGPVTGSLYLCYYTYKTLHTIRDCISCGMTGFFTYKYRLLPDRIQFLITFLAVRIVSSVESE